MNNTGMSGTGVSGATARPPKREQTLATGGDVIAFLEGQHDRIDSLFEAVLAVIGKQREAAFYQLRRLLAVHETAEEQIVHPAARRAGRGSDEVVDDRLAEEHDAKKLLAALEKLDFGTLEFEDGLRKLRDLVRSHAEAEEQEEFEPLTSSLDENRLEQMRRMVELAEAVAPTRPHPGVESALANTLIGPFASMLDRLRDVLTGKR
jgi:hemerythrin superfamily protein